MLSYLGVGVGVKLPDVVLGLIACVPSPFRTYSPAAAKQFLGLVEAVNLERAFVTGPN